MKVSIPFAVLIAGRLIGLIVLAEILDTPPEWVPSGVLPIFPESNSERCGVGADRRPARGLPFGAENPSGWRGAGHQRAHMDRVSKHFGRTQRSGLKTVICKSLACIGVSSAKPFPSVSFTFFPYIISPEANEPPIFSAGC